MSTFFFYGHGKSAAQWLGFQGFEGMAARGKKGNGCSDVWRILQEGQGGGWVAATR